VRDAAGLRWEHARLARSGRPRASTTCGRARPNAGLVDRRAFDSVGA
jgi:hypothetical protein